VPRLLEPPRIEAADLRPFDDDQEYIRAERGIKAVFAKEVHGISLSASSVRSGSEGDDRGISRRQRRYDVERRRIACAQ